MERSSYKRPAKSVDKTTKRLVVETPLPRTLFVLTGLSPASDSVSDTKDDNRQATSIADEPSVIRHEVDVSNVRAKNNVSEGKRVLPEEFFHQMAKQAEACFQ